MVSLPLRWTSWINVRVGGFFERSYLFAEPGLKVFFAIALGLMVLLGSVHLLLYALSKAGLIQNLWQ